MSCLANLEADTINVESIIGLDRVGNQYAVKTPERLSMNGIFISPVHANIPWHSYPCHVRLNMDWRAAVEAAEELLQKFVFEQTANRILVEGGQSYTARAAKELPKVRHNWNRINAYLWPVTSE